MEWSSIQVQAEAVPHLVSVEFLSLCQKQRVFPFPRVRLQVPSFPVRTLLVTANFLDVQYWAPSEGKQEMSLPFPLNGEGFSLSNVPPVPFSE